MDHDRKAVQPRTWYVISSGIEFQEAISPLFLLREGNQGKRLNLLRIEDVCPLGDYDA